MTMTYDPFTPAGGPEQRGYDGRRRAAEPDGGDVWAEPRREWAESRQSEDAQGASVGWVEDPRYAQDYYSGRRHAREEPRWSAELTPEPSPPAGRAERSGRVKPLVIGLVALLVMVAGWQAYRIEGMSQHNEHMATVLTAEKNRTDRLEQQLAGVFDPEAVSSGVLPSVFRVRAGDLTGTAFSVGTKAPDGESNLFTNYHVVASVWSSGGKRVSLERGSTKISATIKKVDKGKDLALLHADQAIAGLTVAGGVVKPGQQVVVVGAPLGLDDSVTTGVISAYRPDSSDGPTIQFDAPINPGNSGGPIVNSGEKVVGVATAKARDAEGIGLAIPIKVACDTFDVC